MIYLHLTDYLSQTESSLSWLLNELRQGKPKRMCLDIPLSPYTLVPINARETAQRQQEHASDYLKD